MKKIDPTVKSETLYISVWTILLSVLMQSVFLIVGLWKLDVLFGNLISGACAVLNFFLMGITVQKALGEKYSDEKNASQLMRFSQSMRMLMQLALVATGAYFFNPVAAIIPIFFPRIAVTFRPLFNKKDIKDVSDNASDDSE